MIPRPPSQTSTTSTEKGPELSRNVHNQLGVITALIGDLRKHTPAALAHAAAITADGYPSGGGGIRGGKNTISDPTALAALNRTSGTHRGYHPADQMQTLEQHLRLATTALRDAITIVHRFQPADGEIPRCSGGAGLDGHHIWGDPACRNIPDGRPSYAGMCNGCAQRRYRWVP